MGGAVIFHRINIWMPGNQKVFVFLVDLSLLGLDICCVLFCLVGLGFFGCYFCDVFCLVFFSCVHFYSFLLAISYLACCKEYLAALWNT